VPAQPPTIAIEGGHAHQGRHLFAIQQAQLRQLGQHRAAHHGPNAGHTLQQFFPRSPHRTPLDHVIQFLIEPCPFVAQPVHMRGNPFSHSIRSPIQAVLLGLLHRQHLAPSRQQDRQLLGRCIGDHPQGRSDDLRKARQHLGIERVRLGQLPVALAQSRTWRGFTTITGTASSTSARSRGRSKPPVASTTINLGRSCASTVVIPLASYVTLLSSPDGRTATSSRAFETSIPTKTNGVCIASSLVKPVLVLMRARWPRQLFGLGWRGT
jgi:hypothetical protein